MKRLLILCLIAVSLFIQGEANRYNTNPGPDSKIMVEIGGEPYLLAAVNRVTWYEAGVYCKEIGMQLVSFENEEKWNLFVEFITANPALYARFWTSGHRPPQAKDFKWTTTGNTFNFTVWNSGKPSLTAQNDACMTFNVELNGWRDDYCVNEANTFGYACENIPA